MSISVNSGGWQDNSGCWWTNGPDGKPTAPGDLEQGGIQGTPEGGVGGINNDGGDGREGNESGFSGMPLGAPKA